MRAASANDQDTVRSGPRKTLVRRPKERRVEEMAKQEGLPSIIGRVLASRHVRYRNSIRDFLNAGLTDLDDPLRLKGMKKSARRVAEAVGEGEVIGLEADYDQDGLGAMAVFRRAFTEIFNHPSDRLNTYVGHRLRDGYGLSWPIVNRILEDESRPTLVITADNGSSDEERIQRLATELIDVIVTDHHAVPVEGAPKSAFSCINPQQDGCEYPDGAVAGGMVAWLLMCAVRNELVEMGRIRAKPNTMVELLDYVACSTVADCVSMASVNNRAVVRYGLRLMNMRPRACWQGMRGMLKTAEIKAETIAFGIAPRVNAQTRLNSADDALNFLLAETVEDAWQYAEVLNKNNEERKRIERDMVDDAIRIADEQVNNGKTSIVCLLEDGHPGVQGICSSRILDRYGRPCFTFCRNVADDAGLTGSGRSGETVHLRDVLQDVENQQPGIFEKFGGHGAAAGASLAREHLEAFSELFERAVRSKLDGKQLESTICSDGELGKEDMTLDALDTLETLEPTGRGFEPPTFDGVFRVQSARPVGDGTHLKLTVRSAAGHFNAIWFRARRNKAEPMPVSAGDERRFVYRLTDNKGYGPRRLELMIEAMV